jgi:uncharacterized membrane protein
LIRALLFLAYACLAHLSVLYSVAALECAALTALAAGILYPRLRAGRAAAWLGLAASAVAAGLAAYFGQGHALMALSSMALPAMVLLAFAASLLPGHTALVTRIAAAAHNPLPPPLLPYTRKVTWLWTLVLAALLLADAYLIAAGSRERWSEFANLELYGVVAVVFLGEYLYRRVRFRRLRQPGFVDYLRLLSKQRPGLT